MKLHAPELCYCPFAGQVALPPASAGEWAGRGGPAARAETLQTIRYRAFKTNLLYPLVEVEAKRTMRPCVRISAGSCS